MPALATSLGGERSTHSISFPSLGPQQSPDGIAMAAEIVNPTPLSSAIRGLLGYRLTAVRLGLSKAVRAFRELGIALKSGIKTLSFSSEVENKVVRHGRNAGGMG